MPKDYVVDIAADHKALHNIAIPTGPVELRLTFFGL